MIELEVLGIHLHPAKSLLVAFALGAVNAQAQVQLTAQPAETWQDLSGRNGFTSSEALLAANNAAHASWFNECLARYAAASSQSYECRRLEMTGIRPNPTFPNRINGNYSYFSVNATWHTSGVSGGQPYSYTTDASNYYAVLRNLVCPQTHGFDPALTSLGPNESRMTCVKYEAPPMQSRGAVGKAAGSCGPGGVGNPITLVGVQKTDVHIDYVGAGGLIKVARIFRGQQTGWTFPGSSEMIDLFSGFGASFSVQEKYVGATIDPQTGATVQTLQVLDFQVIKSSEAGEVYALNSDGSATPYRPDGSNVFLTGIDGDILTRVDPLVTGGAAWRWRRANNVIDDYGFDGRPRKKYWPDGKRVTFNYSSGSLTSIVDNWGRQVTLTYGANTLPDRIELPDGQTIAYTYTGRHLDRVTFPGGAYRSLIYSEPANAPNLFMMAPLTGLIDENGRRVATYRYNNSGRAVSTEGANGANKYTVEYMNTYSRVIPPIGDPYLVYFSTVNGSVVVTSQSQPAGSGCAASSNSRTYDGNGNVTSVTDFTGRRSCHASDSSRNLETVRVEGLSTGAACSGVIPANSVLPADSRKTSTAWHPEWRLETRVAEPGRIVTSIYNGQPDLFAGGAVASCAPASALLPDGRPIAVLCKRVEQATTDANGATGFSAVLQSGVPARTTTWTYNQWGQVLTENGPRTDVNDTTTYAYYSDTSFTGEGATAVGHFMGDLATVTNAAGKVTQYTKYNKHGQVLESVDPNGVVTTNTYDLRQRLLSTTVGNQTASYQYDPVGQLKRVTLPDQSWVGYDYDDAHRQVAVYDHKGNRTDYQLDNAGNRIGEQTKDPSGALKRQLTRSIDALGRVQQTTGRE